MNYRKEIIEIFKNDKRTLKSIQNIIKKSEPTDLELLKFATKKRKTNIKLKKLFEEYNKDNSNSNGFNNEESTFKCVTDCVAEEEVDDWYVDEEEEESILLYDNAYSFFIKNIHTINDIHILEKLSNLLKEEYDNNKKTHHNNIENLVDVIINYLGHLPNNFCDIISKFLNTHEWEMIDLGYKKKKKTGDIVNVKNYDKMEQDKLNDLTLKETKALFKDDITSLKIIKKTIKKCLKKEKSGEFNKVDTINRVLNKLSKHEPEYDKLREIIIKFQHITDLNESSFEPNESSFKHQANKSSDLKEIDIDNTEIPFIINKKTITLFINNDMKVIDTDHLNYKKILKNLTSGNFSKVRLLIDIKSEIIELSNGNFKFKDNTLLFNNKIVNGKIAKVLIELIKNKKRSSLDDTKMNSLMNFYQKLSANPSDRSVNELFGFLKNGNIPISDNGNLLVYKKIKSNFMDCHTGKIDNSIGKEVVMDRADVDDNSNRTCSTGLHVCSYSYLGEFYGDKIVVCEVNPRDVVSIPNDYNYAKMRVCKYKVISDVTNEGDILLNDPLSIYIGK